MRAWFGEALLIGCVVACSSSASTSDAGASSQIPDGSYGLPDGNTIFGEGAAKMLGGISKAMVYRYVQHGELHPIKLGARTMFTREELERFVKKLEADSP